MPSAVPTLSREDMISRALVFAKRWAGQQCEVCPPSHLVADCTCFARCAQFIALLALATELATRRRLGVDS